VAEADKTNKSPSTPSLTDLQTLPSDSFGLGRHTKSGGRKGVIENKRSKQRQLQWLYGEDYFLENVLFGTRDLENVLFCTLKYVGVCGCGCYHVYFSRLYYAYRVH
jgi:hypothetical protein